jgi:D-3-phosphoglycerate dehydrogenase
MKKVLVPSEISEAGNKYLIEKGYDVIVGSNDEDAIIRDIQGCDAFLVRAAKITRRILENAKDLKIVARHGVGYDAVDLEAAKELGIWVTNTPEANATAVAEHTMCGLLACAKKIIPADKAVKSGDFAFGNRELGIDVDGKTIGIIGLGRIGKMVARKCMYGFNMKVIAYDPYLSKEQIPEGITFSGDLREVFAAADFITLHMPATENTKRMVNKSLLALMKPTAYFINCARGDLVAEEDLYETLANKRIAGAMLDVFALEPLPGDSPLLKLDNIITTPHNAGRTAETAARLAVHAAMSIDEVLSGKKPSWPVVVPPNPRMPVK